MPIAAYHDFPDQLEKAIHGFAMVAFSDEEISTYLGQRVEYVAVSVCSHYLQTS